MNNTFDSFLEDSRAKGISGARISKYKIMINNVVGFIDGKDHLKWNSKDIKKMVLGITDKQAEQEIKEVFTYALKHPQMSFIEIMDKFRSEK